MKKDQKQSLKAKSEAELITRLDQISQEIAKLKIDLSMGTLANPKQIKSLKYEYAFIKTILNQK